MEGFSIYTVFGSRSNKNAYFIFFMEENKDNDFLFHEERNKEKRNKDEKQR